MGRKRRTDKHLRARMYCRRVAYYFVEAGSERWIPLGRDYAEAFTKYGKLTDQKRVCVTMHDVIARYRVEVLSKKAATTQKGESRQLTILANWFGAEKPDNITTGDVYDYMEPRAENTPTGARQEVTLLHHVYVKAIRWRAATKNPVRGVEKVMPVPKPKRKVSDEEFAAVYELATPPLKVAMTLALLTGLCKGDLLG